MTYRFLEPQKGLSASVRVQAEKQNWWGIWIRITASNCLMQV